MADSLKKALQYSIDFEELSNKILSRRTILTVYQVLPKDIIQNANNSLKGIKLAKSKKFIEKLQDFMDEEVVNSI